jgi:diacylglycerol kinase family enzyme
MTAMRKAVLIYNTSSGSKRKQRARVVQEALAVLQGAGIEASAVASGSMETAAAEARKARHAGCDAVIACGGDGTAHAVLQGMEGCADSMALGIIPLGTGNILAKNLGVQLHPMQAARALLKAVPTRLPVGKIAWEGGAQVRLFLVAAGVGLDALLMHRMSATHKEQLGMMAYYAEGLRISLTAPLPWFEVAFTESASGKARRERVSQALAARVPKFGGLVRTVAPGARLERDDVHLLLFKTGKRLRYFQKLAACWMNPMWNVPEVELVAARDINCTAVSSSSAGTVYAEADGEALGGLPVHISVIADAITLLAP